jgi:hypothetical protein
MCCCSSLCLPRLHAARVSCCSSSLTSLRYQAFSTFGAISYCNSPDFNGVDGILGFGLPVGALTRAPADPNAPFGGHRRCSARFQLNSFNINVNSHSCIYRTSSAFHLLFLLSRLIPVPSASIDQFLPLPLLFSLTNHNSRDNSVPGGARLIPRRAFSFVRCFLTLLSAK